jgi:hypothetical protein
MGRSTYEHPSPQRYHPNRSVTYKDRHRKLHRPIAPHISQLSLGAKIAVGVGVPVLFFTVVGMYFFVKWGDKGLSRPQRSGTFYEVA